VQSTGQIARFDSFAEFCTTAPPEGLGTTVEKVRKMCRHDPEAERLIAQQVGKNDKNDNNDENDTRRISQRVYENLPQTLRDVALEVDEGYERDSFLTGALPVVAGALPNVRFKYGGHWQSLNLYTAVIAPAGSGKGKMRHARKMADGLHQRLREESRQARKEWEQRKEDENAGDPGPKPPSLRFYTEADNSAANLKQSLSDAPHGVIFETEFKTLSTVLNQDWGQFRDVLLKGFQNEPVEVGRVSEDPVYVPHPAPSIAVSGTPGTFGEVVGDTEDGLFSRFAFYQFQARPEWKSQFGGIGETPLDKAVNRASDILDGAYGQLRHRDEPLYIKFTDEAKTKLNEACAFVMRHWKNDGVRPELFSSLKRAAVRALRIGAAMHLLRMQESGRALGAPRSVEVSTADVLLGMDVAFTYLAHSLSIAAQFKARDEKESLTQKQRGYLDALPNGTFTTSEAKSIASETGVNERTAQRWLKGRFSDAGVIQKMDYGEWKKVSGFGDSENASGVIPVIHVIPVILDTVGGLNVPEMDSQPNGTPSPDRKENAPF